MFVRDFISSAGLLAQRDSGGVTRNPVSCRVAAYRDRPLKKWKVDRSAYAPSLQYELRVPATAPASVA